MSVISVIDRCVKPVVNVVKKHPVASALGVATVGLVGYSVAKGGEKYSRKQQVDLQNHLILSNPMLNPFGYWRHMLNKDADPDIFDNPLAKYFVDANNKNCQEYYDNLSPQERVKEFYRNGGKGVNFDNLA